MNQEDILSLGLPEAITQELVKPEVLAKFAATVEKYKEPVVSKNNELLGKHTELNSFIQSLGGKDAVKALAETAAKAKAEQEALAAKSGDVDAIKRQFQEQLQTVAKERDTFKSQLVDRDVGKRLNDAIRAAKGAPALLEPLIKNRVKSELVDGEVKLTVLGANGQPMLTMDGKDATLTDLIEEFKSNADYARAFEASKASGSGATVNTSNAALAAENPWNPATRNLTKQSQLIQSNPAQAKIMAAMYNVDLRM